MPELPSGDGGLSVVPWRNQKCEGGALRWVEHEARSLGIVGKGGLKAKVRREPPHSPLPSCLLALICLEAATLLHDGQGWVEQKVGGGGGVLSVPAEDRKLPGTAPCQGDACGGQWKQGKDVPQGADGSQTELAFTSCSTIQGKLWLRG